MIAESTQLAPTSRRVPAHLQLALTVAVAMLALLGAPHRASAFSLVDSHVQIDNRVVVSPSAVRVPAVPGRTVVQHLIIQNRTPQPIGFQLQVSEVVGGNAQDQVEIRHGVREGAAAWASIERPQVTIPSGYTATLNVTITVPASAPPGSQSFSITCIQQPQQAQTSQGGGAGVAPIFQQESIFVVDLPGNARIHGTVGKAQVSAASDPSSRTGRQQHWFVGQSGFALSLLYRNSGSRLLTPSGTATVTNLFGHTVRTYTIPRFTVYPGGEDAPTVNLRDFPGFGPLTVHIRLTSEAGTQTETVGRIWRFPGWLRLLVVVLVTILVLWLLTIVWNRFLDDVEVLNDGVPALIARVVLSVAAVALLVLDLAGSLGGSVWRGILIGLTLWIAFLWVDAWRTAKALGDYGDEDWDEDAPL